MFRENQKMRLAMNSGIKIILQVHDIENFENEMFIRARPRMQLKALGNQEIPRFDLEQDDVGRGPEERTQKKTHTHTH